MNFIMSNHGKIPLFNFWTEFINHLRRISIIFYNILNCFKFYSFHGSGMGGVWNNSFHGRSMKHNKENLSFEIIWVFCTCSYRISIVSHKKYNIVWMTNLASVKTKLMGVFMKKTLPFIYICNQKKFPFQHS